MKILIGMSGGVDSTYAAFSLKEAGHTVEGAVLLMHEYTEIDEAVAAAASVGIKIHVIDARERFSEAVIPNFVSEYSRARTPNPCIICNSDVKFRILSNFARENGFDAIATGHYADVVRLETECGTRYALKRAGDFAKDQTYMLWRLPQDILSHLVLPLSTMKKEELRVSAKEEGIISADREDSQEICFIPSGDYASFIKEQGVCVEEGDFVDPAGKTLGRHKGIINYTVGQRKGLGIALGARAFVTDIDPITNRITLSTEPKRSDTFRITGAVFSGMCEMKVGEVASVSVKIRYQAPCTPCEVTYLGGGVAEVKLATPQSSVTAGQSAVFYLNDLLLFGGFIE